MNDLNLLEEQLRSWTPRPPSARIKSRLFRRAPRAAEGVAFLGRHWMAPAMAAVLGVFCLLNSERLLSSAHPGGDALVWEGAVLTNPVFAAYIPGDSHSEQNRAVANWPSAARARAGSRPAVWGTWKTNRLMF